MSAQPTTRAEAEAAEAVASMNKSKSRVSKASQQNLFGNSFFPERRPSIANLLEASTLASKNIDKTSKQDEEEAARQGLLPPPSQFQYQGSPQAYYPYVPSQNVGKSNDLYTQTYGNAGDGTKEGKDDMAYKNSSQVQQQAVRGGYSGYPANNPYNYFAQQNAYQNYPNGGGYNYNQWATPTQMQANQSLEFYNSQFPPEAQLPQRANQTPSQTPIAPKADSNNALADSQVAQFKISQYNSNNTPDASAKSQKQIPESSDTTYVHGGAVLPIRDTQAMAKNYARGTPVSANARKTVVEDNSPRPFPCTFEGCPWSFARQSDQRRHLRSHQKPIFHCPYWRSDPTCHRNGGSFNRQDVLKRHLKLVHFVQFKQSETGWCRVCQKMFPNPKHFVAHCEKCAEDQRPTEWGLSENMANRAKNDAASMANFQQAEVSDQRDRTAVNNNNNNNTNSVMPHMDGSEDGDPNFQAAKPKVTRTRVRKQHDAAQAAREAEASAAAIASAGVKGSTSTLSAFTMKETMKSAAYRHRTEASENGGDGADALGGFRASAPVRIAPSGNSGRQSHGVMNGVGSNMAPPRTDDEDYVRLLVGGGRHGGEEDNGAQDDDSDDGPSGLGTGGEQSLLLEHMRDEGEMDDLNAVTSSLGVSSGPMAQPLFRTAPPRGGDDDDAQRASKRLRSRADHGGPRGGGGVGGETGLVGGGGSASPEYGDGRTMALQEHQQQHQQQQGNTRGTRSAMGAHAAAVPVAASQRTRRAANRRGGTLSASVQAGHHLSK